MKSGFTLLLLAFLLVAMPVVAADLASADAQEFSLGAFETESIVREEVTVMRDGENVTALSVASDTAMGPQLIDKPLSSTAMITIIIVLVVAGTIQYLRKQRERVATMAPALMSA